MKDLDRSKFTQAVLNTGRQAGASEAEIMDPEQDSKSILCFKSIRHVWGTNLRGTSYLGVTRVGHAWFELEERGSRSFKGIQYWMADDKYLTKKIAESL
jgi:hypothetical protein